MFEALKRLFGLSPKPKSTSKPEPSREQKNARKQFSKAHYRRVRARERELLAFQTVKAPWEWRPGPNGGTLTGLGGWRSAAETRLHYGH
jgi:hypothetical protein